MRKHALVVSIAAIALAAACTTGSGKRADRPESSPSATAGSSQDKTTYAHDLLADIPRGPRSHVSWYRTAMVTLNGGERRVWLHADHPRRVATVVAYRGGYLASVFGRNEVLTGGAVFDAEGQRVRHLGGCVRGPVSGPDATLVAWITCSGRASTLHVGPTRDLPEPDQQQVLPDNSTADPYPAAVHDVGVTVQLAEAIRGYLRGAFVANPSTGEVRPLSEVIEVKSVSPLGIACVLEEQGTYALIDLQTSAVVRRLQRPIEVWSPDGARGLVSTDRRKNRSWNVVDIITGKVLRTIELPAGLWIPTARWEDSRNLLFVAEREDFSTILRVTPSGAIERIASVVGGDATPSFL